jgi:hypothetical protein
MPANTSQQIKLQPYGIKNQHSGRTVLRASGITARYATLKRAEDAAKRLNAKKVSNDWVGPVMYVAFYVGE